jgi:hypothetical protein
LPAFDWKKIGDPPKPSELEVTLIGPGFGECIVIHIGPQRWMIIDSCLDSTSRRPVALEYLESLGVNVATDVRWVVATHWHKDHIAGLGDVVEACRAAKFICATVMDQRTLFEFVSAVSATAGGGNVKDFADALDALKSSARSPEWVHNGICIEKFESSVDSDISIFALSPSNSDFTEFLTEIAGKLPKKRQPHRAAVASRPNHIAIAIVIQLTADGVLLGADLEELASDDRGWGAAVKCAKRIGARRASVIKIPHHGSKTAHSPAMWSDLLTQKPVAGITPFNRGRKAGRPPMPDDLLRIASLSSETYLSAPTESGRARAKNSPVEQHLRMMGMVARTIGGDIGVVRHRRVTGRWKTKVFGRARQISPKGKPLPIR